MSASSSRSLSCGSFASFPSYATGALRSALSSVGGRSRLGHIWLFQTGPAAAQTVLGCYRLALAAGHAVCIEPPKGIGNFWLLYVS